MLKLEVNGNLMMTKPDFTAQIDELHPHNQNPVGTFHGTSLLWSTEMKTAVKK